MAHILSRDLVQIRTPEDFEHYKRQIGAYFDDYLESVRDRLPKSAFDFASASWRRDQDHRNLHDAWVESLTIRELSSGDRRELRQLEIEVQLLTAWHDGRMIVNYREVKSYSLESPIELKFPALAIGHGDWLSDEVTLSNNGFVLHEVEFRRGGRWLIECRDIDWSWKAFDSRGYDTPITD